MVRPRSTPPKRLQYGDTSAVAHGFGASFTDSAPEAGAMASICYSHDIGSTALATRLREAEQVLVVPAATAVWTATCG